MSIDHGNFRNVLNRAHREIIISISSYRRWINTCVWRTLHQIMALNLTGRCKKLSCHIKLKFWVSAEELLVSSKIINRWTTTWFQNLWNTTISALCDAYKNLENKQFCSARFDDYSQQIGTVNHIIFIETFENDGIRGTI